MRVPRYVKARPSRPRAALARPADVGAPSGSAGSTARPWPTRSPFPLVEAWSGVPAEELAPSVADKIPQSIAETLRLRFAARRLRTAPSPSATAGRSRSRPASTTSTPSTASPTLCEAIADELGDVVQLSTPVEKIYVEDGVAVGVRAGGFDEAASAVISTAPINVLPKLVEGTDVLEPYRALPVPRLVLVNLKLGGRAAAARHDDVVARRATTRSSGSREATQSMPWLAPEGKTLVTADIGASRR